MATFIDDFERANGALGGNWVTGGGAPLISGGAVASSTSGSAWNTTLSAGDYQECSAMVYSTVASSNRGGPTVKAGVSTVSGWLLCIRGTSAPFTVALVASTTLTTAATFSATLTQPFVPSHLLRLVWDHGHLSGYYQGVLVIEGDSGLHADGSYGGLAVYSGGMSIGSVQIVTGSAVGLDVSPAVMGNYGACVSAVLTGTNTAWTPGTPGSPTFAVNHGSISSQVVTDASHATIIYCPGAYLGAATFTDPTTGATATAIVTSDPLIAPPTGRVLFTDQAVTMVNNTAGDSWLEKLTKPNTPLSVSGYATLELETLLGTVALNTGATVDPDVGSHAPLTEDLYARLWGGEPWQSISFVPPGAGSVKIDTADAVSRLEALITANHWTLGDVIVQLAGEGVKTHLDLWNAIAALDGGTSVDLTSVLEAIAAARGLDAPSIRTVADLVGDLSTAAGYTLGDVHGWIDAIPSPSLTSVLDKLAAMQPSTLHTLSSLAGQSASLVTAVTAIKVELDEVKALLESLEVPAAGGVLAPLWPGEASVTIGASHALSNGLVVDGPMHGILLTITGHPAHNTRYAFGAVSSWARVGQVVFRSDRGDYERSQSFSMDAQVMVPATMEAAEAVTVRLNEGWTGTVRAWSRA